MSGKKRAFGGYTPILIVIGGVAAIGVFVSPVFKKVLEGLSPYSTEISNVKQLTTACATFAADHGDGNFPKSLDELHPDYMDHELLLMFNDSKSGASKPYVYFPLADASKSGSILIASPPISPDKLRIVGFVGGHVLMVRNEDYLQLTTK